MLDTNTEFTVYDHNGIKITGIIEVNDLWLFNQDVHEWSKKSLNDWLDAVEAIQEASRGEGVERLLVYTKTPEAYKFAYLLGFNEIGEINDVKIMARV